jgi:hypothetical protein
MKFGEKYVEENYKKTDEIVNGSLDLMSQKSIIDFYFTYYKGSDRKNLLKDFNTVIKKIIELSDDSINIMEKSNIKDYYIQDKNISLNELIKPLIIQVSKMIKLKNYDIKDTEEYQELIIQSIIKEDLISNEIKENYKKKIQSYKENLERSREKIMERTKESIVMSPFTRKIEGVKLGEIFKLIK